MNRAPTDFFTTHENLCDVVLAEQFPNIVPAIHITTKIFSAPIKRQRPCHYELGRTYLHKSFIRHPRAFIVSLSAILHLCALNYSVDGNDGLGIQVQICSPAWMFHTPPHAIDQRAPVFQNHQLQEFNTSLGSLHLRL
jgi:hypothetical protein